MVSEKMMEDAISGEPQKFLGEEGLRLVARQYSIGSYVFDLLFEDRHGARLIVELQKGTLDRNHTYKILDYYDEYKDKNPKAFIELMVIANRIPHERRRRLESHGISWKEIPEGEFSDMPCDGIESNKYNVSEVNSKEVNVENKKSNKNMSEKSGGKIIPEIYDNIGSILRDMRVERGMATTLTTREVYELYVQRYPDDEEKMRKRGGATLWEYLPGMVSDYCKYGADGSRDKPIIQHLAPRTYRFV